MMCRLILHLLYVFARMEHQPCAGEGHSDDMPGKPKWYKTGDMARIFIGNHVDNVIFR